MTRAAAAAFALLAAVWLFGCGSEQSKLERGIAVDREEAVPEAAGELGETAAERRERIEKEDEERENELFDAAQQHP